MFDPIVDAIEALTAAVQQLNVRHQTQTILDRIELMERHLMASIQNVIDDITAETTLEDSILTLLTSVQQQLKDALANTTVPPDVQAAIDSAFASLEQNKQKLAAAVAANTPAAPGAPARPQK